MRGPSAWLAPQLAVALVALSLAAPGHAQIGNSPAGDTPLTPGGIVIWEDDASGEASGEPNYMRLDPATNMSQAQFDAYVQGHRDAAAASSARVQAEQNRTRERRLLRNVNARGEGLYALVDEPSAGDGDTGASGSGSSSADLEAMLEAIDRVTEAGRSARDLQDLQDLLDKAAKMSTEAHDFLRARILAESRGPGNHIIARPDEADASASTGVRMVTMDDLLLLVASETADSAISSNGFRSAQIVPIYRGYQLDRYGITWRSQNLFAHGPSSVGISANNTIVGMPSAVGQSLDLHPAGPSSVGLSLRLYPEGPSSVGQSLDLYPALCGR